MSYYNYVDEYLDWRVSTSMAAPTYHLWTSRTLWILRRRRDRRCGGSPGDICREI